MEFGSTVARLREGRGLTQAKLAAKAGVSPETVAAWETGDEFPSQEQLLALAVALKVKIGRLVEKDEELMLRVIDGTETYETAVMALVSVVTATCAVALVAVSSTAPESTQLAVRITAAGGVLGLLGRLLLQPTDRRPTSSSSAGPGETPATWCFSSSSAPSSPSPS